MKRKLAWLLMPLVVLVCASLKFTQSASSSSSHQTFAVLPLPEAVNPAAPLPTTFVVDRTDDSVTATACTAAPNDCSLRGAIIAANTNASGNPVLIDLQPATTYNLTRTNATQENAASTGDLDITATVHTVTIAGGGSSGPNASVIDAAGLNTGNFRDRVFHITASGVNVTFQNLIIQNGKATDDGTNGTSTNPTAQNTNRVGGGVLNNGGHVTLTNVTLQSCQAVGKGDSVINDHTTLDAMGGGLASLTATAEVNINDSKFTSDTAAGGNGGNFNNGAGSNAKGGAIYFEGGTLNISGSRIDNCAANGGNGGNQDQNGQTNGGFGGFAQGGGVYVGGGDATIDKTTFESTVANGGNSGTGGNGSEPAGPADGGGVYSLGNVKVTNSTFHLAGATGGRSGNTFGSTCLGSHTSLEGGGARGGAIFADGGSLIINTATFANNFAKGGDGGNGGQTNGGLNCGAHGKGGFAFGGAIANNNAATINIKHATISLNSAQAGNTGINQGGANKPPQLVAEGTGGGIRVGPGSVTLENTITAGNTAANGAGDITGAPTPGPNVDGTVISNGHNLLGVATDAGGFSGTGDKTGANPMLAALADNGGPTQTMKLSAGSAAIDAGVATGATLDQRGLPRTVNDPGVVNAPSSDGTDIGAFEAAPACTLSCHPDITVSNDKDKCGAVVKYRAPATGEACGTVTCDHPSGSFFPVGTTTVICTSSSGPTCNFKITVNDTQAPLIVINAQAIKLWPPDHKYVTLKVSDLVASVRDNCGRKVGVGSVRISSVSSDEPDDANGAGDGNTINDIVIAADCKSVQLRAERSGNGNGRVYTVTLKVMDAAGNVATATAKVTVPHAQNGPAAVDDGPDHTVISGCP